MSLERVRELEHRYRQTQSPEDEIAWLREQARVTGLRRDQLRLSVCLWDPAAFEKAALVALTEAAPLDPETGVAACERLREQFGIGPRLTYFYWKASPLEKLPTYLAQNFSWYVEQVRSSLRGIRTRPWRTHFAAPRTT